MSHPTWHREVCPDCGGPKGHSSYRCAKCSGRPGSKPIHAEKDIIDALQTYYDSVGDSPTQYAWKVYARERHLPQVGSICGRFGSWNKALVAAGLPTRLPGTTRYTTPSGLRAHGRNRQVVTAGDPHARLIEYLETGDGTGWIK